MKIFEKILIIFTKFMTNFTCLKVKISEVKGKNITIVVNPFKGLSCNI